MKLLEQMKHNRLVKILFGLIICILFWYVTAIVVGRGLNGELIVPFPNQIIILGLQKFPIIYPEILSSLFRLIGGLGLALTIGTLIGISLGLKQTVNKVFSPLVHALHPIPKAALTPIFIIIFGLGDLTKILLVMTIAIFPIIINVRDTILNLDQNYFVVAQNLNMSTSSYYKNFIFPAILSELLTTLKISIGIGIAVLYICESMASSNGLGYYISSNSGVNNSEMFVGIMYLSLIGYLLVEIVDIIEKKLIKWK